MIHVGDDELIEILVGFDEGISQAHGFDNVDVVVNVAMLDEQVAFQTVGHRHIRLLGIIGTNGIALIEFVPPGFVEPRVVIAGNGDAHFVEIRKLQDGVRGAVAAC